MSAQGGKSKAGRASRKPKTAAYKNHNVRARNKLRRMLQSNGLAFAKKWAKAKGAMGIFAQVLRSIPDRRRKYLKE